MLKGQGRLDNEVTAVVGERALARHFDVSLASVNRDEVKVVVLIILAELFCNELRVMTSTCVKSVN